MSVNLKTIVHFVLAVPPEGDEDEGFIIDLPLPREEVVKIAGVMTHCANDPTLAGFVLRIHEGQIEIFSDYPKEILEGIGERDN